MPLISRGKKGSDPFLPLLAALALAAGAAPAAAMWDGVRWNMSEAQVLAATRGQTSRAEGWAGRRVKPTRQPAMMLKDRVSGERVFGEVRVQAIFWFDPQGRLWSVTEEPVELDGPLATCGALEAALVARNGETDIVTDKGTYRHLIWRDEPKKTRIHFREDDGGCAIEYRELRGPLDR
jgi:hypothetical protein